MPAAVDRPESALPVSAPPEGAAEASPTLPSLGRVLLRRGLPLGLAFVVAAVAVVALAVQRERQDDAQSALDAARLARYLGHLPQLSDSQALAVLSAHTPPRHLALHVADAEKRTLLGQSLPASAIVPSVSWAVPRPSGGPWTVTLVPAPHDAWADILQAAGVTLAALGAGLAAYLGLLHWALRRTLSPLQALRDAVQTAPRRLSSLATLPKQPVRELEHLAGALRYLGAALGRDAAALRERAARAQALRDQQQAQLATGLNEGVLQGMTALRLDLTWLQRQLAGNPSFQPVLDSLMGRLASLQQRLRATLAQLQPLAGGARHALPVLNAVPGTEIGAADSLQRLSERLQDLTDTWSGAAAGRLQCRLDFRFTGPLSQPLQPALALAVFRLCQDACSLAAHDAVARELSLQVHVDTSAGLLHWAALDDGRGGLEHPTRHALTADTLASLQHQAWMAGGSLAQATGPEGRGRSLAASLPLTH